MQALLQARREIAGELVVPIRQNVARKDTGHAAFHGCIDWHSAVHGVWALTAYTRMTGDATCVGLLEETLRPEKLAAERTLLAARPDFEMPYGRAWFLRLAREHGLYAGNGALWPQLQSMAGEVLDSMLAYYGGQRRPDPRRGSYQSDSWALINMLDYAAWSGDAAAEAAIRGLVEAHFLDHGGGCDWALENGHFMAVATNWAWLVGKVLPQRGFRPLAAGVLCRGRPAATRRQAGQLAPPRTQLQPRLGSVGALRGECARTQAREAYLAAYAAHFRATYDTPSLWRGSYQGVGHWVPQFGMLALQPLFEVER